jgi:prepilin-type N-terminal cleavage/methylation domain-containing protein
MVKVKTATSSAADHEGGFTLFELLIALLVMASVSSFVAVSMSNRADTSVIDRAQQNLVSDLQRARLEARSRGLGVDVLIDESGYQMAQIDIDRDWPTGVEVVWRSRQFERWNDVRRVTITPRRLSSLNLDIELQRDGVERHVIYDPISGRVHAE